MLQLCPNSSSQSWTVQIILFSLIFIVKRFKSISLQSAVSKEIFNRYELMCECTPIKILSFWKPKLNNYQGPIFHCVKIYQTAEVRYTNTHMNSYAKHSHLQIVVVVVVVIIRSDAPSHFTFLCASTICIIHSLSHVPFETERRRKKQV